MSRDDESKMSCPTCGEKIADGVVHDTVERVVRANNRYGDTRAGERVRIELRHVDHPSVMQSTMAIEELEMLHALSPKPSDKPVPRLLAMVQQSLEGTIAATRAQIENGKRAAARAAETAGEILSG